MKTFTIDKVTNHRPVCVIWSELLMESWSVILMILTVLHPPPRCCIEAHHSSEAQLFWSSQEPGPLLEIQQDHLTWACVFMWADPQWRCDGSTFQVIISNLRRFCKSDRARGMPKEWTYYFAPGSNDSTLLCMMSWPKMWSQRRKSLPVLFLLFSCKAFHIYLNGLTLILWSHKLCPHLLLSGGQLEGTHSNPNREWFNWTLKRYRNSAVKSEKHKHSRSNLPRADASPESPHF